MRRKIRLYIATYCLRKATNLLDDGCYIFEMYHDISILRLYTSLSDIWFSMAVAFAPEIKEAMA